MRVALFIVTCLLTAGCTRTEEAQPQPFPVTAQTAASKPQKTDTRRVVAVLGDSLAEGYGVPEGRSFPDLVEKRLNRTGLGVRIVNLGVSGDTTTGGLSRISYALSLRPEILLLELGGNDGLRGLPVTETKANLQSMIGQAQKAHVRVLLAGMTLPLNYGPDYIRSFENIYKDLAKQNHLPLIPFLMEKIRDRLTSTPGLMQGDGIHPTVAGHELIAETVVEYLQPMLSH